MACNCLLVTGLILICVGALFAFLSLVTVYWVTYDDGIRYVNYGLYRYCVEHKPTGIEACDDVEDPDDYNIGTRSCGTIAVIVSVIAVLLSFVHLYKVTKRTANKSMLTGIFILCLIAVVFLVIGAIVYGALYQDDDSFNEEWVLGASFGLSIVAAVILGVAGILIFQSFQPDQAIPHRGAVVNAYPGAQPGYPQGQPVMMPATSYGHQPVHHLPPYNNAQGYPVQPMAPGYGMQQPSYGNQNGMQQPSYGNQYGMQQPQASGSQAGAAPANPQPYSSAANAAFAQPDGTKAAVAGGGSGNGTVEQPPAPAKY